MHYLQKQKTKATVIVPFLAFVVFLAGYIETSGYSFIVEYKVLNGREALTHGRNTNSLLRSERFCGKMLTLRVNFS